jgi:hypothetical protein
MRFIVVLLVCYLIFPAIGFYQMRTNPKSSTPEATTQPENRYEQGRTLMRWGFIALGIAAVSAFILMGLPGGVVVGLLDVIGLTPGAGAGDRAWPSAIIASLGLPLIIPLGIWLRQLLENAGYAPWKPYVFPVSIVIALVILTLILRKA